MKRDYIDFQDRSIASAYFITFRCYGTWFHGDERGSMDRKSNNRYGSPKIGRNPRLEAAEVRQTVLPPFILGREARTLVEASIRELCRVREYTLHAVNVRTNHVHIVVANAGSVERMMNAFKAFATKALRSAGIVGPDVRAWSRHGSTRYLWTEEHILTAVDYVVNGQDGGVFDRDAGKLGGEREIR